MAILPLWHLLCTLCCTNGVMHEHPHSRVIHPGWLLQPPYVRDIWSTARMEALAITLGNFGKQNMNVWFILKLEFSHVVVVLIWLNNDFLHIHLNNNSASYCLQWADFQQIPLWGYMLMKYLFWPHCIVYGSLVWLSVARMKIALWSDMFYSLVRTCHIIAIWYVLFIS